MTIDVAIITWPNHPVRLDYFFQTVNALRANLTAIHYELCYICSAESQVDPLRTWSGDPLSAYCQEYGIRLKWRGGPANLGANMNAAMRSGDGNFVFLVQDDWLLLEPLDLSAGIELLNCHPEIDVLRYNYPERDSLPTFQPLENGWQWIDPTSDWFYGDDPHLRRRNFMEHWGWYLEGSGHASASGDMMQRLRDGGARIAASDHRYFRHLGRVTSLIDDARPQRTPR